MGMQTFIFRMFLTWTICSMLTSTSFADGFIVIHDPPPIETRHHSFAPLAVTRHHVTITVRDQVATTTVDQEFYNPNTRDLEGTYLFPVPKDSHIDKFEMEIGGKLMAAELLPAEKARKIYEDIVRKQKDPALLEYIDRDVFKLRIFPIEGRSKKRIRLSYTELLPYDGGSITLRYPLSTERFSSAPLEQVSIAVDIECEREIGPVLCPSHDATISRDGPKRATVRWEDRHVRPETDFEIAFAPVHADGLATGLVTWRSAPDDPGYFLLLTAPPPLPADADAEPKDVVIVADTSGSMAGEKIEQARKALTFCVQNLNTKDRFELIPFSTEARPVFGKLVDVTPENCARALKAIDAIKPIGGTAIGDALERAIALQDDSDSGRPTVVIFVTDGLPTVGETDTTKLLDQVARAHAHVRIFSFGVGTKVNTRLLDGIADRTYAFSQYVGDREDLEIKLSGFFSRIKDPVLTQLALEFGDGVKVDRLYPRELPDVFSGDQLIVAGRYDGSGTVDVRLRGKHRGREITHQFTAAFPERSRQNEFVARLWATRRVAWLLEEVRAKREDKEIVEEISALAREFGIVTPYTAYLILEDEARRDVPVAQRTFRSLESSDLDKSVARSAIDSFRQREDGTVAVRNAEAQNAMKYAGSGGGRSISSGKVKDEMKLAVAESAAVAGVVPATTSGAEVAEAVERVGNVGASARRIAGVTFVQNGGQWVDTRAQSGRGAVQRIQFDSPEYYALLTSDIRLAQQLAVGRNVLINHKNKLIEIYE